MTVRVLYISYDGMLEPLGQSQVLAYLERLAHGRKIHLISYEKPMDWAQLSRRRTVAARIASAGIEWHPLRYHKRPTAPATAYDVIVGTALALALALRHRISIVHARSYVAALIAVAVKCVTGARFLFDMRGFWADERVDGGLWPAHGKLYRIAKKLERTFLRAADHVVTLTHASEREIRNFSCLGAESLPISVISTCADLDRFTIQGPLSRSPFVLGYVGSAGTWYLLDEMLQCFRILSEELPDSRLLVVNRNEQEFIRQRLGSMGIDSASVEIVSADQKEMPALIGRMSAGMAFIKPVYSKIASAPTKLGEYLACGVPCLSNVGVGDVESILEERRVGVAVPGFSRGELYAGIQRLLALTSEAGLQERCRRAAFDLFSLEQGVQQYELIYESLLSREPTGVERS